MFYKEKLFYDHIEVSIKKEDDSDYFELEIDNYARNKGIASLTRKDLEALQKND